MRSAAADDEAGGAMGAGGGGARSSDDEDDGGGIAAAAAAAALAGSCGAAAAPPPSRRTLESCCLSSITSSRSARSCANSSCNHQRAAQTHAHKAEAGCSAKRIERCVYVHVGCLVVVVLVAVPRWWNRAWQSYAAAYIARIARERRVDRRQLLVQLGKGGLALLLRHPFAQRKTDTRTRGVSVVTKSTPVSFHHTDPRVSHALSLLVRSDLAEQD